MKQEIESVISEFGLWLPLLALHAGKIENWTAKIKNLSAEATNLLKESTDYSNDRRKEVDKIVQTARAAAGEAGAAEFTHEFRDEAALLEKRGKTWLLPTCVFALLALILSILFVFYGVGEVPISNIEAAYRFGGRVIGISVLIYAAIWSGRVVLANLHLSSVNKHRAISLQTLQAFHHAAEDIATKDAVVLEAARAVYENVPSGYIGRQVAEHGGNTRMLEIVKGVTQSKS